MSAKDDLPRLYRDLADWWPLLSTPGHYAEEAEFYTRTLQASCASAPLTLLEMGSGGGNNASHMKAHFQLTLVDLSPAMLKVSRQLNPQCEHIEGDMRTVRLGRTFDAVFIHDAIMYMQTEADLRQTLETAYIHCRSGGAVLLAPDCTRETFKPSTAHGGHDGGGRSLRYLEWTWDPDPNDTTFISDMVYVLREGSGQVICIPERHVLGLFSQEAWMHLMTSVGFQAQCLPFVHSDIPSGLMHVFLGKKPG
jgi:SAM-dependent methyltransferase